MQLTRVVVLGATILTLVAACWLTGCGGKTELPAASIDAANPAETVESTSPAVTPTAAKRPAPKPVDPVVVLHTSLGDVQLQLFIEKAPQSVDNFLANYARRGFYNDTVFHHIEAGSMVIAGGYTADLQAKETRYPVLNEANNGLLNKRGAVALIREPSLPHSATSQFFINVADNPTLDYQSDETGEGWGYCVFGQVIAGMDVVDKIAQCDVGPQGDFSKVPREPVIIRSVEQIK
ncbi:MAG: peptidylprolyl isomerase [Pirellulaceae bacterium]|nr:peptidylprolyl isomerase [Pirellulaceae bacterium]